MLINSVNLQARTQQVQNQNLKTRKQNSPNFGAKLPVKKSVAKTTILKRLLEAIFKRPLKYLNDRVKLLAQSKNLLNEELAQQISRESRNYFIKL